jgi:uncharacterized membrane protein YccC
MSELMQICRDALYALGRELAAWRPSAERALFGIQAVISVVLSVAVAHLLDLPNAWWAAISGFAVMQIRFAASMQRGMHRILGTVLGALLGTLAGPLIGDRPWLFVPVLGLIGGFTVYIANGSATPYAWVLGGVTAIMVIYEAHLLLALKATASFAMLRVAEVTVGTLACVLVSASFFLYLRWYRRHRPGSAVAAAAETVSHAALPAWETTYRARAVLGTQAGIAIGILAALAYALNLPGFAQALVTATAVLILPASALMAPTHKPVAQRMVQRMAGCLLAGIIGVALLPLAQGQTVLCLLALSLGVWTGCHVQSGREGASYIGAQFVIAFIMVFVQDHQWSADPYPAMLRLAGIAAGIAILTGVMLVVNRMPFLSGPNQAAS